MSHKIKDIAKALGFPFEGNGELEIERPRAPDQASAADLAIAFDPKYEDAIANTGAKAGLVWHDADWQKYGLEAAILAPKSRYTMAGLTDYFETERTLAPSIHPSAIISETAQIGDGASIGPFVIIGEGVTIGKGARIFAQTTISDNTTIGDNFCALEGVRIGRNVVIGDRVFIQSNAVIGGDGFSYVMPNPGALEDARRSGNLKREYDAQSYERINSLGGVHIGDDVEIGALTGIDAGTIEPTRVGSGTKIDNCVQLGHNVVVGENCLLCAQFGMAGSSKMGNYCIMGGQVGMADNLTMGNHVIAAMADITNDAKDGTVLMGSPAMPKQKYIEQYKAFLRLPRLIKQVRGTK